MTRAVVAAMTAYTLELREAEIKLNQNESPSDFPAGLKQQVLDAVAVRHWNIYPDFESAGLRGALAAAHGLTPESILVGNGSNELLAAALGAFVGPGTPVIIPTPTFTLYEKLVTIAGGVPIRVAIDPQTGQLPLDQMLAAIEGARRQTGTEIIVIVCSPNNPTGGVLPEGGLVRLLDSGATVFFDRAYGDFARDSLPALHDRLVTFSTFSKAWGLAGLRVGWLASTAANCREIRKVKLPYSLNIVSEEAATLALAHEELRRRNVDATLRERERVAEALRTIEGIEPFPSRANFVAFRVARGARQLFDDLHIRGVLIRDISSAVPNALRVSIGSSAQNDRFLGALRDAVSQSTESVSLPPRSVTAEAGQTDEAAGASRKESK